MPCWQGPMGKHQGQLRGRDEVGETVGKHMQFLQEETDKVGQASVGLVSLNNFSRLWGVRDRLCYCY